MYLVIEGKWKINQLGYAPKTHEYVYYHKGKEIWREKGDTSLLDYCNEKRANYECIDSDKLLKLSAGHIYKRYSDNCHEFEVREEL